MLYWRRNGGDDVAYILMVEDDDLLSRGLAFALEKENHKVFSAYNYREGYAAFLKEEFDLVLLDINLTDGSGKELCTEIRRNSDIPIIFITAKDTEQDMIQGFQQGCDDYIAKPFSLDILKQRISAILRRTGMMDKAKDQDGIRWGELRIDFKRMMVLKAGQQVRLTATEYKLLELLVRNRGQVLTRQIILEKLWDVEGNFVDENALRVNIRRLRQKLEDNPHHPVYIITVFGIGYTWGDSP